MYYKCIYYSSLFYVQISLHRTSDYQQFRFDDICDNGELAYCWLWGECRHGAVVYEEVGLYLFCFLRNIYIYVFLKRPESTHEVKMAWESVGFRQLPLGRVRLLTREVLSQIHFQTRYVRTQPLPQKAHLMPVIWAGPLTKSVPVHSHTELMIRFY